MIHWNATLKWCLHFTLMSHNINALFCNGRFCIMSFTFDTLLSWDWYIFHRCQQTIQNLKIVNLQLYKTDKRSKSSDLQMFGIFPWLKQLSINFLLIDSQLINNFSALILMLSSQVWTNPKALVIPQSVEPTATRSIGLLMSKHFSLE